MRNTPGRKYGKDKTDDVDVHGAKRSINNCADVGFKLETPLLYPFVTRFEAVNPKE